ncbi:flagellar basal body rod protein FlgB [Zobellella taiwanensis]|uniref:Flagellar basal body rod protein FlgB n=1 Tax=Zobellella taiwanensis TaxID=347535 RepID=A0A2P7R328_9GAMM|nr:flagellar basal body rod protein FlgB [Zobellella taiwanensis]PSJ44628.1 flagellar basal body rod protein FlgB [Zobellella taiwanensis]
MAISFDKAFGVHQHALVARSERAELLAGNLANADTPGYKAKDMDFQAALSHAQNNQNFSLSRTHLQHFAVELAPPGTVQYRVPNQPDTGDGNTVDAQTERNNYMENALQYQASLEFLNSKISGLLKAIKGDSM